MEGPAVRRCSKGTGFDASSTVSPLLSQKHQCHNADTTPRHKRREESSGVSLFLLSTRFAPKRNSAVRVCEREEEKYQRQQAPTLPTRPVVHNFMAWECTAQDSLMLAHACCNACICKHAAGKPLSLSGPLQNHILSTLTKHRGTPTVGERRRTNRKHPLVA